MSQIEFPCGCKNVLLRAELHYRFDVISYFCHIHSKERSKDIRRDFNALEAWDNYAP